MKIIYPVMLFAVSALAQDKCHQRVCRLRVGEVCISTFALTP
jgi:hypothetical protein